MNQIVTRSLLQTCGMSKYHTQVITKSLTPTDKKGQAYVYSLSEVISTIKEYIQRPRVKNYTRELLGSTLTKLLNLLGNVVEIPFLEGADPEIRTIFTKLTQAMAKTDATLAALKVDADEIEKKYKVAR